MIAPPFRGRSVHSLGSKVTAADHPDARAVFYENELYSKRKINDLFQVLAAFETAAEVRALFHAAPPSGAGARAASSAAVPDLLPSLTSPLLRRVLHTRFPDPAPLLAPLTAAFDPAQARRENRVTPRAGADAKYDAAVAAVADVEGGCPRAP
jgi:hypothetical protein